MTRTRTAAAVTYAAQACTSSATSFWSTGTLLCHLCFPGLRNSLPECQEAIGLPQASTGTLAAWASGVSSDCRPPRMGSSSSPPRSDPALPLQPQSLSASAALSNREGFGTSGAPSSYAGRGTPCRSWPGFLRTSFSSRPRCDFSSLASLYLHRFKSQSSSTNSLTGLVVLASRVPQSSYVCACRPRVTLLDLLSSCWRYRIVFVSFLPVMLPEAGPNISPLSTCKSSDDLERKDSKNSFSSSN